MGAEKRDRRGWGEDQQSPGDQRRAGLSCRLVPLGADVASHHRDHHAGQHATGDDLEQDVRQ